MYGSPEDVRHIFEATFKVRDKTKVRRPTEDTVNKMAHHLIKDAHEKTLTNSYTELYQMAKQAAAKAIHLRRANDQINNKARKLGASRDFTKHRIHQLI